MSVDPTPLSYATAAPHGGPSYGARVWAGAAICLAGIVLLVIGGCFCIGIMAQLQNTASPFAAPSQIAWKTRDYVFHVVLYALAFICFGCGTIVMVRGLVGLLRVMNGKAHA